MVTGKHDSENELFLNISVVSLNLTIFAIVLFSLNIYGT